MTKVQPGDRVRYVGDDVPPGKGETGVVLQVDDHPFYPVLVAANDGFDMWYADSELEKIEEVTE